MSEAFLTRAGYQKLIRDLARLQDKRAQLSQDLAEARDAGDARERADYAGIQKNIKELTNRIAALQDKLGRAKFFNDLPNPRETVTVGCSVTVSDESGDEQCYTLVGEDEADPAEGRISVCAPIAQGLLGKRVGEQARVDLPAGPRLLKILKAESAR